MASEAAARRALSRVAGVAPGELVATGAARVLARRHASAARCLDSASAALAGFGRGRHVFGLTKGQFSMIDLAAAVLAQAGPAAVSVWTWAIADYEVEAVEAFVRDGRISSFRLVIDFSGARRNAALLGYLQDRFGLDCIRVTKTHAKVATFASDDGWRVVVRGSMNLNCNPRFENFDVSDDAATFGVVHGLEDEIWSKAPAVPVDRVSHAQALSAFGAGELVSAPPAWAQGLKERWW